MGIKNSDYAIVLEHLTKRFVRRYENHYSLKRALLSLGRPARIDHFTALSDISFRVPHGQTLAVVGSNGSGKSTLLSLLARVYRPTLGKVEMSGKDGRPPRVAPLLELGAGLHPELDGIDNIGFYGSILGMNAKQVREKTDSIIAFAELEDKAGIVIRNWNDGARLRLGFSIAVHIDPDILLVDEVLAVGDEAFQNKCFRKIDELKGRGATIVFVSHDLPVVEKVADRVIWIDRSLLRMDGTVSEVLTAYKEASTT